MNHPTDENLTAVNVIRCVYLARLACDRGDHAAARRWQAKADIWLRASPIVPPLDPQGVPIVPTRGP